MNQLPLTAEGVSECICSKVVDEANDDAITYPVNFNWINNLVWKGREMLAIEFLGETLEVDHWTYGPHHAWTRIESGEIVRMWQPFNGLQIYPTGVSK